MVQIIEGKAAGEHLFITLQGNTCEEVGNAAARQIAYKARHTYGYDNAGIDVAGGPFVVDISKDDPDHPGVKGVQVPISKMAEISKRVADIGYRQVYRLTRGLR